MNISQAKLLKPLSVHEHTHQVQTFCERKNIHVTVPLSHQTAAETLWPSAQVYRRLEMSWGEKGESRRTRK